MTSTADLHFYHLQQALASGQESDWHDFKLNLIGQPQVDALRKDLVALANTRDGPYGEYRYLIIGVDDVGTVTGLAPQDPDRTEDRRARRIGDLISRAIFPLMQVQVKEYTVNEKTVHVVIVPQAEERWHMVTGDMDNGFWIRRNRGSVRPTAEQVENYLVQRVQAQVLPLREQVLRLDDRLGQLREMANVRQSQAHPELATAAQHTRVAFLTPDRTLLRLVRSEANTFLDRRAGHMEAVQQARPDYWVQSREPMPDAARIQLRQVFEQTEEATRPLVETVGTLIHDAEPSPRVQLALAELNAVITDASVHQLRLNGPTFALWVYPALLYLHGVAASSAPHWDWSVLAQVLHHHQDVPSLNLSRRHVALSSVLPWRQALDDVARLVEPVPSGQAAAYRMERLLHQSDWVGQTLPVMGRLGAYSRGEAVLTLGYIAAALARHVSAPPPFPAQWWTYLNADAILEETLLRFAQMGEPVLAGLEYEVVAEVFDRMEKSGSHLTLKASYFPVFSGRESGQSGC